MSFPTYYNPSDVESVYAPRLQDAYVEGAAERLSVGPASADKRRILLWLIDMQIDFVLPDPIGKLPVPGAVEDTKRLIEWLYTHVGEVTAISASLDQHFPMQIFHPPWWIDAHGNNPAPFTVISHDDVRRGVWKPLVRPKESVGYVTELEKSAKKQLMIWPFHCLKGSVGASLVPALTEAIQYHSAARHAQPMYLPKGEIVDTEFYSVLEPEVKRPGNPQGGLNTVFLDALNQYDLVYIAGQAKSHCVLETMKSTLNYFAKDRNVLSKLRFLDDCTSIIPGFEAATDAAMKSFVSQGVSIVKSLDPLG